MVLVEERAKTCQRVYRKSDFNAEAQRKTESGTEGGWPIFLCESLHLSLRLCVENGVLVHFLRAKTLSVQCGWILAPMPMTIQQIADAALALPSEQRALLAERLVESLGAAESNRVDRLWATEAKRRRDEVRQGLVKTIPGDEVLAEVRRSLGR